MSPVWSTSAGDCGSAFSLATASWSVAVTSLFASLLNPMWLSLIWAKKMLFRCASVNSCPGFSLKEVGIPPASVQTVAVPAQAMQRRNPRRSRPSSLMLAMKLEPVGRVLPCSSKLVSSRSLCLSICGPRKSSAVRSRVNRPLVGGVYSRLFCYPFPVTRYPLPASRCCPIIAAYSATQTHQSHRAISEMKSERRVGAHGSSHQAELQRDEQTGGADGRRAAQHQAQRRARNGDGVDAARAVPGAGANVQAGAARLLTRDDVQPG